MDRREQLRAVLLATLLVVSAIAIPIAAAAPVAASQSVTQPASMTTAQPASIGTADTGGITFDHTTTNDSEFESRLSDACDKSNPARFAFPISCGFADPRTGHIDETETANMVKTDLHTEARSLYEGLLQTDSIYQNYLEDTETIAAIEARHAIATAYENGKTANEAQTAAQTAISNYYSQHQKQIAEIYSAHNAELAYYINVTQQHSNIDNNYIVPVPQTDHSFSGYGGDANGVNVRNTDDTFNSTYTLANGNTTDILLVDVNFRVDSCCGYDSHYMSQFFSWDHYNKSADMYEFPDVDYDATGTTQVDWSGVHNMVSHTTAGFYSYNPYDMRILNARMEQAEKQAQAVQANFPNSLAEDMYAAMDAGELSPNEVRGAEGMVRYLSSDYDTETALNLALRHSLDLGNPEELGSQVEISTDNLKTNRERNVSGTGSVSYDYTTFDGETMKGTLFVSGLPVGLIEQGKTYDVSKLDSATMMTGSGEFVFYSGNFTVEAIYDGDGNEIDSLSYSEPEYGTYNSTEYIQELERIKEVRTEIVESMESDGSDGTADWDFGGIPGVPSGINAGGALAAILLIAGLLFVAMAFNRQ